jgi:hypothetical protein
MISRLSKPFFILFILVGLLGTIYQPAMACSCIIPGPPQQEMENASAVFTGRVVNVRAPGGAVISSADPVLVAFEVTRIWKGPLEAQIALTTARDSASCGFEFQQGQEYIVYAYEDESGLATNLCTRTALLEAAGEDLQALGEGSAPPALPQETSRSPILLWLLVGGVIVLGIGVLAAGLFLKPRREK